MRTTRVSAQGSGRGIRLRSAGLKTAAIATAFGVAVALAAPTAANAAVVPQISRAGAIFVAGGLVDQLDPILDLNGTVATSPGTGSASDPVDADALNGLNGLPSLPGSVSLPLGQGISLPINFGTTQLLGDNGIVKLGVVSQSAQANPDGRSFGFAGSLSDAPSGLGISTVSTPPVGSDPAATITLDTPLLNVDTEIGAIDALVSVTSPGAAPVSDYRLAGVKLVIGGGQLGSLLGQITSLLPGGASTSILDGAVSAGSSGITVDVDKLLQENTDPSGPHDINDLPENYQLLDIVVPAVQQLLTGLLGEIPTDGQDPITGVLSQVTGGLFGLIGTLTGSNLGGLGTVLQQLGTTLGLGSNGSVPTALGTALSQIISLEVNNPTTSTDGVTGTTRLTENALSVGLLPAALGTIDLATASAGGNIVPDNSVSGQSITHDGATLIANPGNLSDPTYQWLRDGQPIAGATGQRYTLTPADDGHEISVLINGTTPGGNPGSATVNDPGNGSGVSGGNHVGDVLTANPGGLVNPTYQWYRDGSPIPGATGQKYTLTAADEGHVISVQMKGDGSTIVKYLDGTPNGSDLPPSGDGNGNGANSGTIVAGVIHPDTPHIFGTKHVGSKLTSTRGRWYPTTDVNSKVTSFTYQWLANGKAIKGATKTTYTLKAAELGKKITLKVTGTKAGYAPITRVSAATVKITKGNLHKVTPHIFGSKKVGKALTTTVGVWYPHTAATKLSFQWYANGKAIKGATKRTFTPSGSYAGKKVVFKVTGKRSGYNNVSASSKAVTITR